MSLTLMTRRNAGNWKSPTSVDVSLVDAFVIYGSESPIPSELNLEKPKILALYPPSAEGQLLGVNLDYLCFPEGYKACNTGKTFHVSLTHSDGSKRFASSLISKNSNFALCLISQIPLFNFLEQILHVAMDAIEAEQTGDAEISNYSLEFLISLVFHHFRYNKSWNKEVNVAEGDRRRQLFRYRNWSSTEPAYPLFSFHPLFDRVRPEHVVELIRHILLERKILIVHTDYSENALLIEALLQLISPFQWNFVNISYVSFEMLDYVDMPMPYIIGMSRKVFQQACASRGRSWIPPDVVLCDVDNQLITFQESETPFPKSLSASFVAPVVSALRIHFNNVNKFQQFGGKANEDAFLDLTLNIKLLCQDALLNLLKLVPQYIYPNSSFSAPASSLFDEKSYLISVPEEMKAFLTELSHTQAFSNFVEKIQAAKKEPNEITFFLELIKSPLEERDVYKKKVQSQMLLACHNVAYFAVEELRRIYQKSLEEGEASICAEETKDSCSGTKWIDCTKVVKRMPGMHCIKPRTLDATINYSRIIAPRSKALIGRENVLWKKGKTINQSRDEKWGIQI